MNIFNGFFNTGPFMPHGHCYFWTTGLVALHALADALIVLAYYSIPITLVYFVRKRKDIEFNWMFVCFAVFIMACGTTHLMEIWNIWHANYWLSGSIKAITALASVPTAILLVKLVPQALALPSTTQLNRVNETLQAEIAERKRAEARLREVNEGLEARVDERTNELVRANEALRASESHFRQIAESLPQLVWTCQPDGSCDFLSQRWVDFTGIPAARQLGSGWLEQVHPDDRDRLVKAWKASVATASIFKVEFRIRRHDGGHRWFDTRAAPLRDENGRVVKWFGSNTEITERKAAEEKIRQLNVELEQRVIERTAQLQSANQELEAFSYSVSHDLRAPLRHVLGFVNLLQQSAGPSLSEKSLRLLTTISQAAKRMGNLIDDLLAFSRVGRAELQKTDVNLDELVRETLGDFQAETRERNIVWKIHALPAVRADRALLRLALVNLISNAVKFTGARTEAKIEINCVPGGSDETVIFIRDNGVGFDPRYVGKLFGVFQRLHSESEFEGTGIGLANVHRIIHRHGGRAWAEGVADGGATFYFSIPKPNGGINEH